MLKELTLKQNPNPARPRFSVKKAIIDEVQRADLLRWCAEGEPVFEILEPLPDPDLSPAALYTFGKSFYL